MPQSFWNLTAPAEARAQFIPQIPPLTGHETLSTEQALGRILTTTLSSPQTLPAFPRSAMDGYAVRATDTAAATADKPVSLRIVGEVTMGTAAQMNISSGQAVIVHTGGMVPPGADAVVRLEDTARTAANLAVEVSIPPGENMIAVGEDIHTGDQMLTAGHRLREQDIGGLLSVGIVEVQIAPRPRVAIFSSGDEVVPPHQTPQLGQVRDVNSFTVAALVGQAGGIPERYPVLPDNFDAMLAGVQAAYNNDVDMIILSAGSSVSDRDMTPDVFNALGDPGVLVHGLATKPGKPTIFGLAGRVPLIGLPGNPVSSFVQFLMSGVPVLYRLQGAEPPENLILPVRLAADVYSVDWREDYIPARFIRQDGELLVEAIPFKSNLIFRLVEANGLIKVPIGTTHVPAGELIEVRVL